MAVLQIDHAVAPCRQQNVYMLYGKASCRERSYSMLKGKVPGTSLAIAHGVRDHTLGNYVDLFAHQQRVNFNDRVRAVQIATLYILNQLSTDEHQLGTTYQHTRAQTYYACILSTASP